MSDARRIGFAGIGLMGRPLVLRLLSAGFDVAVWNRSADKLDEVVAAGARAVATPAQLRRSCRIIVLCLADTNAVRDVVFSHDGIASEAAALDSTTDDSARLVLDLSSIDPAATRDMAARLTAACDIDWVDAPVSGGVIGAQQGTLVVMAGGTDEALASVRPLLAAISQRCTHMGPVGAGQVTKLCNQMIVGCNVLALAEVFGFARRAGIDAERLPEALAGGFADSIPLQMTGPMMATGSETPVRWRVRTLLKDLETAAAAADGDTPLTRFAAGILREHGAQGFLDADPATLVRRYMHTLLPPEDDD